MRHQIFLHIVWTTRDREPLIDAKGAVILRRLLPGMARQERARIVELGMVRTHVHALVEVHPTTSIPRLMQRLKGGSSVIVNRERGSSRLNPLRWAKGYSISSVSPLAVERVRSYVRRQPTHHPAEAIRDPRGKISRSQRVALATVGEPSRGFSSGKKEFYPSSNRFARAGL
jgi:REP element-mobilizing transposase RayT